MSQKYTFIRFQICLGAARLMVTDIREYCIPYHNTKMSLQLLHHTFYTRRQRPRPPTPPTYPTTTHTHTHETTDLRAKLVVYFICLVGAEKKPNTNVLLNTSADTTTTTTALLNTMSCYCSFSIKKQKVHPF